jgi:hypothetical protein
MCYHHALCTAWNNGIAQYACIYKQTEVIRNFGPWSAKPDKPPIYCHDVVRNSVPAAQAQRYDRRDLIHHIHCTGKSLLEKKMRPTGTRASRLALTGKKLEHKEVLDLT